MLRTSAGTPVELNHAGEHGLPVMLAAGGIAVCVLVMLLVMGGAVIIASVADGTSANMSFAEVREMFGWMLKVAGSVWGGAMLYLFLIDRYIVDPGEKGRAPLGQEAAGNADRPQLEY